MVAECNLQAAKYYLALVTESPHIRGSAYVRLGPIAADAVSGSIEQYLLLFRSPAMRRFGRLRNMGKEVARTRRPAQAERKIAALLA